MGSFFEDLSMYDQAVNLFDEVALIDKRIYGAVHSKVHFHSNNLFVFYLIVNVLLQVAEDLQHQVQVNLKLAKFDMAESLAEQVLGKSITTVVFYFYKINLYKIQICIPKFMEEIISSVLIA